MRDNYTDAIEYEIFNVFAGCDTLLNDSAVQIVEGYRTSWIDLPCDEDGATDEQRKNMVAFVDDVIQDLKDADSIWKNNYVFSYVNKTEDYAEYDGTVVNAPDEDTAWYLFDTMDGEYKMPNCEEYECNKVEEE